MNFTDPAKKIFFFGRYTKYPDHQHSAVFSKKSWVKQYCTSWKIMTSRDHREETKGWNNYHLGQHRIKTTQRLAVQSSTSPVPGYFWCLLTKWVGPCDFRWLPWQWGKETWLFLSRAFSGRETKSKLSEMDINDQHKHQFHNYLCHTCQKRIICMELIFWNNHLRVDEYLHQKVLTNQMMLNQWAGSLRERHDVVASVASVLDSPIFANFWSSVLEMKLLHSPDL